jgi:hypothetical protein
MPRMTVGFIGFECIDEYPESESEGAHLPDLFNDEEVDDEVAGDEDIDDENIDDEVIDDEVIDDEAFDDEKFDNGWRRESQRFPTRVSVGSGSAVPISGSSLDISKSTGISGSTSVVAANIS